MSGSSIFFQIGIAAFSLALGVGLGATVNPPFWIVYISYSVCILAFLFCMGLIWLERRGTHFERLHQRVTEADRWDRERMAERKANLLEEFWQSDAGKAIRKVSFLANGSVRVVPIGSGYVPESYGGFGTYTLQFNETHVAHIQVQVARLLSRRARIIRWLEHIRGSR